MDLLSEIVTKEFLTLMEVSDRPGLSMNLLATADGRTPTASRAGKDAANKSVGNLLAEFDVLRSAVIRRVRAANRRVRNLMPSMPTSLMSA